MNQDSDELRRQMIAEAAYFRAELRGFDNGNPTTDWLEAEADVDVDLHRTDRAVDDYEEKLTAASEWIKALKRNLRDAPAEQREEWEASIERLTTLHRRFKRRLAHLRRQDPPANTTTKQQAQIIWDEISDLIERLRPRQTRRRR